MVKLVDTLDLKSNDWKSCGGSSPPPGTKYKKYNMAKVIKTFYEKLTDIAYVFAILIVLGLAIFMVGMFLVNL